MRLIRSFMWLRWRLLANSIRGGQRRDTMERISRAIALAVPFILAALSFGSIVAIAILGFIAGRAITTGLVEPNLVVLVLRGVLAVGLALTIIVTLGSPAQSTVTRYTRLLLLPIPQRTLHVVEVFASLADPWIAFLAPGLVTFALGLAIGGRVTAGAIALVGGVLMVATLATLGALVGFLVAWLMRSRRRGEMFTLVFVLALTFLAVIPAMISDDLDHRRSERKQGVSRQPFSVAKFDAALPAWTQGLPSELYGRAMREGMAGRTGVTAVSLGAIALELGVLFVVSSAVHGRLLRSLEGSRSKRRSAASAGAGIRLPFIGPAASAIACAQWRTAIRSVRGRLLVLMPGPLMALLLFIFRGIPSETWAQVLSARGHFALGAVIIFSLYALQAFSMNLFGSDRSGLSLQFLSPVTDTDLARGKIAGCAMILGAMVLLGLIAVVAVVPGGSLFLWIATILGGLATFLLLSPIAVWLSALFPVASDLSKTGSGGNPHGFPMLLGTVLVLVLSAPALGILLLAEFWFEQPALGLALMAGWTFIAAAVAWPLVTLASRTIGLRRENLALVAQGK